MLDTIEREPTTPGTTVTWQRTTYRTVLTPVQTQNRLGAFEAVVAPESGPPRHRHLKEDETIFVLQGEAVFWLEGETRSCSAGDVVFVPRGAEHTFRVIGEQPARFLTIVTPGGFESFFAAVANRNLALPEDAQAIGVIAKAYNAVFTGPPLGA